MYAIIRSGGKQYRVRQGDRIRVERLEGDVGSQVLLEDVLLLVADSDSPVQKVGEKAKVQATIEEHGLGDKVLVFKFKRRKKYRRLRGHRQAFTTLRIEEILSDSNEDRMKKAAPAEKKKKTAKPSVEPKATVESAASERPEAAPVKQDKAKAASEKEVAPKEVKKAGGKTAKVEKKAKEKTPPARKSRKKADSKESDSE